MKLLNFQEKSLDVLMMRKHALKMWGNEPSTAGNMRDKIAESELYRDTAESLEKDCYKWVMSVTPGLASYLRNVGYRKLSKKLVNKYLSRNCR